MAVPAAILVAKAAVLTASSERGRTVVLSVVAALLTPFLLIVTMLLCTLSGTADHNISAVQLSFHGDIYLQRCQQSTGCISKICRIASENWTVC